MYYIREWSIIYFFHLFFLLNHFHNNPSYTFLVSSTSPFFFIPLYFLKQEKHFFFKLIITSEYCKTMSFTSFSFVSFGLKVANNTIQRTSLALNGILLFTSVLGDGRLPSTGRPEDVCLSIPTTSSF